jgi:GAF domain-containing protein
MRRRGKAGGKAIKTQRRKALKRRNAPKTARRRSTAATTQEVARLTRELDEAREQQSAISEILRAISNSPGNVQPVLDTVAKHAARICEAQVVDIILVENNLLRIGASFGELGRNPGESMSLNRSTVMGRSIYDKQPVQVADLQNAGDDFASGREFAIRFGHRSALGVPLIREGRALGTILVRRAEVRPFDQKTIALLTTFADQAIIAIEDVRLFEAEQRRRHELSETLQQQTATADVLKVISRSTFDLQTVLDTLVVSAAKLCDADKAYIFQLQSGIYQFAANYGFSPELLEFAKQNPIVPGRGTITGRVALEGKTIHVPDVLADPEFTGHGYQSRGNFRTTLGVPLMREGKTIGVFFLARSPVKPFTDKQIELVETFADQAVIAIENARLFDAEQQRTRQLTESLEQQTATADVLKVISNSPGELESVFDAILENATRICQAGFGTLNLYDGGAFLSVALHNPPPEFAARKGEVIRPHPESGLAYVARTKKIAHIDDIRTRQPYLEGDKAVVGLADLAGARTLLIVPMLKEDELIGAISIYRQEVRSFTDKQIELVTNFAAQAVIAIENARLLNELRESLQQQTATADVLKVISRSTFDLQTVLQTLVESAARLCDADKVNITRQRDGIFYRAEAYGFSPEFMDYVRNIPIQAERGSAFGRALLEGRAVHIPDVKADPEYTLVEGQRLGGYRTVLAVPMLREGVPTGVLSLTRSEVRPFTEKQIELASTFADQAAIAIENVRLFDSVEARTRELANSLEDLRRTQDRLVQTQKLASLGQLTAGIAHEIKNPLNFVNNFSGVSAELVDELQEALKDSSLNEKRRSEITELMDTLRGNLDKIVQHGKRADAIVKNMLLHSREGSGEHRLVDINALVEESLNLAYHGARAEKQGFNVTLERSFDPAAGHADVFPQDITRVLLNLISNGFYATTKRKAEAGDGHEPTLVASTRSLGDRVEIRVRDNGTGIPPEVKEKIFNPFFTTKPAGEGTGLGLSISHDVIVKQHGGSIEVESEPGAFSEFIIVLPRVGAPVTKSGEPS